MIHINGVHHPDVHLAFVVRAGASGNDGHLGAIKRTAGRKGSGGARSEGEQRSARLRGEARPVLAVGRSVFVVFLFVGVVVLGVWVVVVCFCCFCFVLLLLVFLLWHNCRQYFLT